MTFHAPFRLMMASAATIAFTTGAHAELDAKKVTDAITAQLAGNGMTLTVASSELSGANVIAKGVSITMPGSTTTTELGEVTLENVTENGDGYIVGKVAAPAFETKIEEDKVVKFGGASMSNVNVAGASEADPVKKLFMYDGFEMAALDVEYKGKQVFHMEGAKGTMTPYKPGETLQFDMAATGIHIDLMASGDPKFEETVTGLGYTEANGEFTAKGSWNPADGRIAMLEGFDFKDVGRLNVNVDLSGYTPAFVTSLQAMNKGLEGKADSAKGMAALGLIQQLTFNTLSFRYDDASLTGRILDFTAKQAGQTRADVVNQAKGMVPIMTMMLQDPDFAQKVTTAVSAYLDDPKSIEINATPAAPVSFAIIAATAMSAPKELLKQLNVNVTANQ